jgi:hypothetical protein
VLGPRPFCIVALNLPARHQYRDSWQLRPPLFTEGATIKLETTTHFQQSVPPNANAASPLSLAEQPVPQAYHHKHQLSHPAHPEVTRLISPRKPALCLVSKSAEPTQRQTARSLHHEQRFAVCASLSSPVRLLASWKTLDEECLVSRRPVKRRRPSAESCDHPLSSHFTTPCHHGLGIWQSIGPLPLARNNSSTAVWPPWFVSPIPPHQIQPPRSNEIHREGLPNF